MKLSVIITAGGVGKRFSSSVPKQFLPLIEFPILMRTIRVFYHWNTGAEIILTLPKEWFSYWEELIEQYKFKIEHRIVEGGKERFHSIKNALQLCNGDFVMIHDGVRPLVNVKTLDRCGSALETQNAVIPYLKIKDSIRMLNSTGSVSLDRNKHIAIQTPQCFSKNIIQRAYQSDYKSYFTDDASVVEYSGVSIHLVEGNEENIKITTPLDMQIAETIIKNIE